MSATAGAADLFFVIGQTNSLWRGQRIAAIVPAEAKFITWKPTSKFNSVADPSCEEECPGIRALDGVVPSFANTWVGLSRSAAHFALHRRNEVPLTWAASGENGYWTDYDGRSAKSSVYLDALRDFRAAQESAEQASPEGVQRRYLVWIQSEADAHVGVSAKDYKTKLSELFERFSSDLGDQGKALDGMLIVSTGMHRDAPGRIVSRSSAIDKLNAIVQAQDLAAAEGKLVLVSRSMQTLLGMCASGVGSAGCETKALLRYYAASYELLGAEMARNAYIFHSKGVKPLLPESCKIEPTFCAATVDVYRWQVKDGSAHESVYGTDPYEFSESTHVFGGRHFTLFRDMAPGRVPLYRDATPGKVGLSINPGQSKSGPLGYCYATASENANLSLLATKYRGSIQVGRYPAEANSKGKKSNSQDEHLCYVS